MVEDTRRYDIKGKSHIGTPMKYYFMDIGLRNAKINFRQMEVTRSMENIFYNELTMLGYSIDAGNLSIVGQGKDGKPIKKQLKVDFICNKGAKREEADKILDYQLRVCEQKSVNTDLLRPFQVLCKHQKLI